MVFVVVFVFFLFFFFLFFFLFLFFVFFVFVFFFEEIVYSLSAMVNINQTELKPLTVVSSFLFSRDTVTDSALKCDG